MHAEPNLMRNGALGRLAALAGACLLMALDPSPAWAQSNPAPAQPVPYPTLPPPVPYGTTSPPAASPAPRPATNVGQDIIYMKNGGILRGTIVDAIPHAQARIQLATGEIATVAWEDIARIVHAEDVRPTAHPPAPAPTSAPPAPPPTQAPSATVWVHLDGPDEARLQQDATGNADWRTVCSPPCDQPLPTGPDYRIDGAGLKTSSVFKLSGGQGDRVTLTVGAGSKAWFIVGIVATPLGGLVTMIGLLTGLVGTLGESVATGAQRQEVGSIASAGWAIFGVGAAALVGGIVLLVSNSKTTAAQDVSAAQGAALVTHRPLPTWREAGPEEKVLPPVVGGPLWTAHF
jgi:hypothetical protein